MYGLNLKGQLLTIMTCIIPGDYDNGLIMMSYTDGKYAKMLESVHLNGDNFLVKGVHKEIKQLLGITPPKPGFISVHYWNDGIYFWKNGINMNDLRRNYKTIR